MYVIILTVYTVKWSSGESWLNGERKNKFTFKFQVLSTYQDSSLIKFNNGMLMSHAEKFQLNFSFRLVLAHSCNVHEISKL